jgi:hypothetical protein
MMAAMTKAPSPLRRVVAPLVALLVVLVVFSPSLLVGAAPSPLGLLFVGAGLLGGGLFLRRVGGPEVRTIGAPLAVVGAVLGIGAVVLLVLLLGGLGRPF